MITHEHDSHIISSYHKIITKNKFILSNGIYESFYCVPLEYLSHWDYFHIFLLIAQTNLSEEHELKIFFSQNNISEAWENFLKNNKAHCAQKDISEVLEQLPSWKDLSEAHIIIC